MQLNQSLHDRTDNPPRVFSIPPGLPFLPTLAEQLVTGAFADDAGKPDPLTLSQGVVYLPTRRAARAFGMEFLQAHERLTGRKAVLLPRVRTIGDLDDDEALLSLKSPTNGQDEGNPYPDDPLIVSHSLRQRVLAFLLKEWGQRMNAPRDALYEGEAPVLPSSSADALRLADGMCRFIDQMETEEIEWSAIRSIGKDDLGQWWQLTLDFLDIVMNAWPGWLAEQSLIDPANARRLLIERRIQELQTNPPSGPVIAAGSTGSIPATSRLLKTIAAMPNGAVVLPGLDPELPEPTVKQFTSRQELLPETALSTHPQYGMMRLVAFLGSSNEKVQELGTPSGAMRNRSRLLKAVMTPSEATETWVSDSWRLDRENLGEALQGMVLAEAQNDHEEALAIAIMMREALETPGKTAALVTPDRQLARRVSCELERFGIAIDDSAGADLSGSCSGVFLRLLLRCIFQQTDAILLSAFLKHELLCLGRNQDEARRIGELIELVAVRDQIDVCDIADLSNRLETVRMRIIEGGRLDSRIRAITDHDWRSMVEFASALRTATEPLVCIRDTVKATNLSEIAGVIGETVLACSKTDEGAVRFAEAAGGQAVMTLLQSHASSEGDPFRFDLSEMPSVFDALMAGKVYRTSERTHPRLHIYGQLEARLQHFDLMILGSLNEGTWPQTSSQDPFLNRPMKSEIGLSLPERRIGLAAHDFVQFSGEREVVYTRSGRSGDAPTVASRWIQRLKAFIGKDASEEITARGNRYLELARKIDSMAERQEPARQPNPTPPVHSRPKTLSITEIETWIRDPYAIYARHVLEIEPLPVLVRSPDPALRGSLYHAILADFVLESGDLPEEEAWQLLMAVADRHFKLASLPIDIDRAWRHRFERVGAGFLKWELSRRQAIAETHCEVRARHEVGNTGFVLRGIADRIDLLRSGGLAIIDYKTGLYPSRKVARTLAPQLSLEGALAARGAFTGVGSISPATLSYVRLRPDDAFREEDIGKEGKQVVPAEALSEEAYARLIDHINAYKISDQGYLSRYAPALEQEMSGIYDHLARVREWSISEWDEGEGGA